MKTILLISISVFLYSSGIMAQERGSIINELNTDYPNQGKIVVLQDESISDTLGQHHSINTASIMNGHDVYTSYVMVEGYKILVFAGNNQNVSRAEAQTKLAQVHAAFPEQEVSLIYQAPFWRVLAGSFLTRNEAEEVLKDMKKAFPSFGKEMYIVDKQKVKRPTY